MKKLLEYSPLIAVAIIIAVLIVLFAVGVFDAPKGMTVTSATLTDVVETAKLTTAKYIQHGIAKAHIEGTETGYVLYYAIVKPNIDLADVVYDVNPEKKQVTAILPATFVFDVELLDDENHKFYYYPDNKADWTGKDVAYICETDARQKAEANEELIKKARESLEKSMRALLDPLLKSNGYTLEIEWRLA